MKKIKKLFSFLLITVFVVLSFSVFDVYAADVITSGQYCIQNAATQRCIDVEGPLLEEGTIIQEWEYHGGSQCIWDIQRQSDGYYTIRSLFSGKYIGVENNSSSTGVAIKQYASNSQDGTKWSFSMNSNGAYVIKSKAVGSLELVLAVPSVSGGNGQDLTQLYYSNDTDYRDEWFLIKYVNMPLSGSELVYSPDLWNYQPVRGYTNCYAYARNSQTYPNTNIRWTLQDPGSAAGYEYETLDIQVDWIVECVEADAEVLNFIFEPIGKYEQCPIGSYKVALFIDPMDDYHWYRQNPNGSWSHKLSSNPISLLDASGKIILDPESADRKYEFINYTDFAGYFRITPINTYYVSNLSTLSDENNYIDIEYDVDKHKLPTQQDAQKIVRGMTYDEVTECIGLSQRKVSSGMIILEYKLNDGTSLLVDYMRQGNNLIVSRVRYYNCEIGDFK